ncbi:MAG: tRNA pseudouridine(55) synthase TruB, partial [Candidatus Omnitrophota bacterium]|nr:tRNA pseudouridine(55) synthase TruB [Candidatus Omnitrophota bacterium]
MDGILIINKPKGITSHDVVNIVRRRFNIRKVGHAGTLDPMATGVLVLLIGKATKLFNTFMSGDKEYIAKVFLGSSTDTQDATGNTIEEKPVNGLDLSAIKDALNTFIGEIDQIPPMVSAKKYKGRKLYELAR